MLGGISGYEVSETTDENPECVALIQKVTLVYLRRRLLGEVDGWSALRRSIAGGAESMATIESKDS